VLILFTPILFVVGPPAPGTFEVQAELNVYRAATGNATDFYVHPVGSTVVYATMGIRASSNFTWNGVCPTIGLTWSSWQNVSNGQAEVASLTTNPVVVNVSATYAEGGATAIYAAALAFFVSAGTLYSAVCFGASPPSAEPVSSLPLVLLLHDWGSGGPP
jgi:hypothetical protein